MLSDVLASIRRVVPRIHREGYPFIAIAGFGTLLLLWFGGGPLFWIALALTIWVVLFFRDPPRVSPQRAGLVLAPADGTVCFVGPAVPPPELGLSTTALPRVSIFMSVFDAHVNRAPIEGVITKIAYKPGVFLNADLDKASEDNERNSLMMVDGEGRRFGVVQIAGLVARRIVSFAREGDRMAPGQRFGLIRFGSRVDVYMPEGSVALVAIGQTMVAGETVIADLGSGEPPRPTRVE